MKYLYLLFLALHVVACSDNSHSSQADTNGVISTDTLTQTTLPLTLKQSRLYTAFPFPNTAKNIHIGSYRRGVAAIDIFRFEAPVDDCLATAQAIIDRHNQDNPDNQVENLSASLHLDWVIDSTEPIEAPWFDPHLIKEGQTGGSPGSHTPIVWVDTEQGVFYYQYTD